MEPITSSLVQSLAKYLVVAMLTWAPARVHLCHGEKEPFVLERYKSIATDLAEVALSPDEKPFFAGVDGRYKSALFMDAWMSFESGQYRSDIDNVDGTGDGGKAHCLAQIQLRPGEVMLDRKDCFRLAFARMRESFKACPMLPLMQKGSVYAAGDCTRGRAASETRMSRAVKWWKDSPFLPPVDLSMVGFSSDGS